MCTLLVTGAEIILLPNLVIHGTIQLKLLILCFDGVTRVSYRFSVSFRGIRQLDSAFTSL